VYRPGTEQIVADALSRREQDTLGEDDKRSRFRRFLAPEHVAHWPAPAEKGVVVATTSTFILPSLNSQNPAAFPADNGGPFQDHELNDLWHKILPNDSLYGLVLKAVQDGVRTLPAEVKMKLQAGDCSIDQKGYLRHRGKLWVPGVPVCLESEYNDTDSEAL